MAKRLKRWCGNDYGEAVSVVAETKERAREIIRLAGLAVVTDYEFRRYFYEDPAHTTIVSESAWRGEDRIYPSLGASVLEDRDG